MPVFEQLLSDCITLYWVSSMERNSLKNEPFPCSLVPELTRLANYQL